MTMMQLTAIAQLFDARPPSAQVHDIQPQCTPTHSVPGRQHLHFGPRVDHHPWANRPPFLMSLRTAANCSSRLSTAVGGFRLEGPPTNPATPRTCQFAVDLRGSHARIGLRLASWWLLARAPMAAGSSLESSLWEWCPTPPKP